MVGLHQTALLGVAKSLSTLGVAESLFTIICVCTGIQLTVVVVAGGQC